MENGYSNLYWGVKQGLVVVCARMKDVVTNRYTTYLCVYICSSNQIAFSSSGYGSISPHLLMLLALNYQVREATTRNPSATHVKVNDLKHQRRRLHKIRSFSYSVYITITSCLVAPSYATRYSRNPHREIPWWCGLPSHLQFPLRFPMASGKEELFDFTRDIETFQFIVTIYHVVGVGTRDYGY